MALRYADMVKFSPGAVTDEFFAELQRHFSDAEICEIGYLLLAYGGTHNFLVSIGEDVVDENGESLVSDEGPFGKEGFPLSYDTHLRRREYQPPELSALDAPLPSASAKG